MKKKLISIVFIFMLMIPALFVLNNLNDSHFSEHSNKSINMFSAPKPYSSDSAFNSNPIFKSRADWANTSFEFRRAITVTERAGITLPPASYPVEIHVTFDPPAFFDSQVYHSIRLYDGFTEVPIQIYDYSWYDYSSRLISEANIAFYADLSASQSKTYYLYWSSEPVSQVNYSPAVSYSTTSTGYVFTTDIYTVETRNDFGGKIYRITLAGVDVVHGSEDEYMDKSAHFSPIFNPTYSAASKGSVQLLALNGHYMGGISDNSNHDQPQITIAGPIFVEYKVSNLAIMQGDTVIAHADVTYRFYKYFFKVQEKIEFGGSVSGEFWIGGWHVDQDDGSGTGVFDVVYMNQESLNGYSYPRTLQNVETYDDADVSLDTGGSRTVWTRFYVFNSTWRFGLGYLYLNYDAYQVSISQADSIWMNEGSSDDWSAPQSASGSRGSDGSGGWSFYVMAGRRVYVYYRFHIDDPLGFWDDADISVVIKDPYGSVVPGQSYYSGEPAPRDGAISFDFVASYTGWYRLEFDYDSADDWGTNDDDMWWSSYMIYLTSSGYAIADDYLLWGNRVQVSSTPGGYLEMDYNMIPWSGYDASWYNDFCSEMSDPPSTAVSGTVEQYYSFVSINVVDKDNKPIRNASVYLDGTRDYNGYTDSNGQITFKVERDFYFVSVQFSSMNFTYTNSTTISISYDYSLDKNIEYTFVMDVVKLSIKFVAADNVTTLQGAKIVLSNVNYGSVNLTSDLEGMASVYLRPAVWWVGKLEAAYPGVMYDNFTIINALTGDPIVENVNETNIDVNAYHSWVIVDHMAKEVKPTSRFEIHYGSPAQSVYWGRSLMWRIKWVDQFGSALDLSQGNKTTDYFSWEIRYASSDEPVIINGVELSYYYTPTNASLVVYYDNGVPVYEIKLNTSMLSADETYYIVIDGYMDIRQKPPLMYLFFDVNSIPTVNTLDVASQVYWNESLDIEFYIWDSGGNPLSGADVTMKLYDESNAVVYTTRVPETSLGVYTLTLHCSFAPGHYYLYIEYSKPNYAPGYVPMRDVFVLERPTRLQLQDINPTPIESSEEYIKVYWGNYSIELSFEYMDLLKFLGVLDCDVSASLSKITPQGNMLIASPTLSYNGSTQTYDAIIDIGSLDVGTYVFHVEFFKQNYISQSKTVTIIVEERPVNIVLGSDYITSYYGQSVIARFYVEDVLNSEVLKIARSDFSVRVRELESSTAVNISAIVFDNGTVAIYYPSNLAPSKYVTSIIVSKHNYQTDSREFYLEVKERPTYITTTKKYIKVTWGDEVSLYMWYVDMLNGSSIYAENYSVRIIGKSNVPLPLDIDLQISIYQGSVAYVLKFNSSLLSAGETYDIYVWFDRSYYEENSAIVKLYVEPISLKVYYDEEVSVYKNPIDSSGRLEYSFELKDISEGHGNRTFSADAVRYELIGSYKVLMSGTLKLNSDGKYVLSLDVSKLDVGSYRLKIYITVSNATITNAKGGIISVLMKVDYFGGSVELLGKKMPVLIVVPALIGLFLLIGIGLYYLWVYVHIPWEVKYINRLIKLIENGERTFEAVDRAAEIERIAYDLME